MILHTIIVRGSLILAEFSDSEEDYSNIIKKRIPDVKNGQENQKILKDDIYLYAINDKDLKFICLSKEDDESIFVKLQTLIQAAQQIETDGNYSAKLTQILHKHLKKDQVVVIQDEKSDQQSPQQTRLINQPILEKKDQIDFQKKLCFSVMLLILSVYLILNNIITNA
ncbi:unnamed protein product (macronuclear) [Paramecium tetraurelia]|uniref:Chromosome undetermined scaffold_26, whole genome shotgun sequence n=1 Tax=Paramecium tetraurelia TaxID=5888 RepID=Q3SEQ3_PARTE|nr:uncharacterized protein GSPATT00009953001 [Paramecium tetraurelia]CAH69609.2 synaptobrevin 5-1 [Paramecium tetraurelia]CAK73681.1 unnamed protein product [Paramecium tetraurelia]|eukprot:XP_001441078.1 hypothetical protein (macronuclear) [Paramecium tetraurelia strain d4-2]